MKKVIFCLLATVILFGISCNKTDTINPNPLLIQNVDTIQQKIQGKWLCYFAYNAGFIGPRYFTMSDNYFYLFKNDSIEIRKPGPIIFKMPYLIQKTINECWTDSTMILFTDSIPTLIPDGINYKDTLISSSSKIEFKGNDTLILIHGFFGNCEWAVHKFIRM